MKKLILLSILLIVGCEETLEPDTTAPYQFEGDVCVQAPNYDSQANYIITYC